MKTKIVSALFFASLLGTGAGATNDLAGTLQRGLFEEEANHNLNAAIAAYEGLLSQYDKDRKLAATAVFRLGECYRKQGKTNEATAQYERLLRDFSDQSELAVFSRQNLLTLGAPTIAGGSPATTDAGKAEQLRLLREEMALVEKKLTMQQQLRDNGRLESMDLIWTTQRELLELKRQAAALESGVSSKTAANRDTSTTSSPENEEIRRIQEMIQQSPDLINAPNSSGSTPLQDAASKGQLAVVQYLLDHGAEVNHGSKHGWNALHQATLHGHKAVVELLLDRGADIEARSGSGQTTLQLAASEGFKTIVELLLAHHANVAARDSRMETPLHKAAALGHLQVVQLLVAAQADVNAKNSATLNLNALDPRTSGATPLVGAIFGEHAATVEFLLSNKAEINFRCSAVITYQKIVQGGPLQFAIAVKNAPIVEMLLKHGADPNTQMFNTPDDEPALIQAIENDTKDTVPLLLAYHADPNLADASGRTALHHAVALRKAELVEMLLATNVEVNAQDREGRTPLCGAVANGDEKITAMLLEHKADANIKDMSGETPLHYAARSGQAKLVALLLEHRADANAVNSQGQTPLALTQGPQQGNGPFPGPVPSPGVFRLNLPTRGVRMPNSAGTQTQEPLEIQELLRSHGALVELPNFSVIRITRPGSLPATTVFSVHTNVQNRFSLLETIGNFYGREESGILGNPASSMRLGSTAHHGLPFPNLSKIKVRRPLSPDKPAEQQEIAVDITQGLGLDCGKDTWLKPGDLVEIPEREHGLTEAQVGLTDQQIASLKDCLQRQVKVRIKGRPLNQAELKDAFTTVDLVLSGQQSDTYLSRALRMEAIQKFLRSSSDFSQVHVTRPDSGSGKRLEWTEDVQAFWNGQLPLADDLWLRDGDLIEVPEKL